MGWPEVAAVAVLVGYALGVAVGIHTGRTS